MKQTVPCIAYVDAIKGFAMLFIVFGHIAQYNLGVGAYQPIQIFFATFSVPIFFFVSGYFAYHRPEEWSLTRLKTPLSKKFCAQILGMVLIWFVYQYATHQSLTFFIYDGFSMYWFTVGLFQLFMLYVFISYISRLCKSSAIENLLLLTLAIGTVLVVVKVGYNQLFEYRSLRVLSWTFLMPNVQFFVCGLLFKKYYDIAIRFMQSNLFRFIVITIYILSLMIIFSLDIKQNFYTIYALFYGQIVKYAGMLTVFIAFFSWREYLDSSALGARCIKMIGSRTLDIYYLHYFFIPVIPGVSIIMTNPTNNVVILQLVVLTSVALAVVGVSLLVSAVLRTSPIMARILFGAKTEINLIK